MTEELLRFADAVEPTLNQKGIALELDLNTNRITAVPRLRFLGRCCSICCGMPRTRLRSGRRSIWGAEQQITIRTQSQGEQIMLQFADTGIRGLRRMICLRIFDPFFTKKGVQGGGNQCNNPGLGLTLVHSVVMDMGGHIWADSVRGAGTTIHVLIPVSV